MLAGGWTRRRRAGYRRPASARRHRDIVLGLGGEASPLLSAAGLVMVSPSNTSPVLTSDLAGNAGPHYHPGYFRTANNDLYSGQAVAEFAYGE